MFKPDMIQAIVEGRKTQTRRVIKQLSPEYEWEVIDAGEPILMFKDGIGGCIFLKPRYHAGETVYIKEAYRFAIPFDNLSPSEIYYKYGAFQRRYLLDGVLCGENPYSLTMIDGRVRSPLFMPEWAARHFILITGVRAERLQEITVSDCVSDGYPLGDIPDSLNLRQLEIAIAMRIGWYHTLWNSINPKYPWESNPWVFAYTFRRKIPHT